MGVNPMPGVLKFLDRCRERKIPIAIATSAKRVDTEEELRMLGWRDRFCVIVTSDDVARTKPAPDPFLEAARLLGVDPWECLAFEDGVNGAKSARAAGMKVVFIRDDRFGTPPPAEASLTVASFEEILIA